MFVSFDVCRDSSAAMVGIAALTPPYRSGHTADDTVLATSVIVWWM